MSSPYIRLSKAAIKAKLTQNENLIFHALMVQTLGYRKSVDNLTDKRLAYLAGLRSDHFRSALNSFLQHHLFYRIEHQDYDYQYRICDKFLDDDASAIVHPPSLPKSGEAREVRESLPNIGEDSAQTLGKPPEVGEHTTENLYIKKPHPTNQTEQKPFTKKTKTNKTKKKTPQEKQTTAQVSISFVGLETLPEQLVIESNQPVRLELSAKEIGKITQVDQQTQQTQQTMAENEYDTQPIAKTKPITAPIEAFVSKATVEKANKPKTKTATAKTVAELATHVMATMDKANTTNTQQTQNPVIASDKKLPKRCALPSVIDEAHIHACRRYFDPLTEQQQQDVLTIFSQQLKTGTIKNKHRYFIGLAKKAQQGGLTVPTHSSTSSIAPFQSPEYFAAEKEANKEREERALLWSDYQWVQQQAATQNKTEQEIASTMGMEQAYIAFGQQQPLSNACAA